MSKKPIGHHFCQPRVHASLPPPPARPPSARHPRILCTPPPPSRFPHAPTGQFRPGWKDTGLSGEDDPCLTPRRCISSGSFLRIVHLAVQRPTFTLLPVFLECFVCAATSFHLFSPPLNSHSSVHLALSLAFVTAIRPIDLRSYEHAPPLSNAPCCAAARTHPAHAPTSVRALSMLAAAAALQRPCAAALQRAVLRRCPYTPCARSYERARARFRCSPPPPPSNAPVLPPSNAPRRAVSPARSRERARFRRCRCRLQRRRTALPLLHTPPPTNAPRRTVARARSRERAQFRRRCRRLQHRRTALPLPHRASAAAPRFRRRTALPPLHTPPPSNAPRRTVARARSRERAQFRRRRRLQHRRTTLPPLHRASAAAHVAAIQRTALHRRPRTRAGALQRPRAAALQRAAPHRRPCTLAGARAVSPAAVRVCSRHPICATPRTARFRRPAPPSPASLARACIARTRLHRSHAHSFSTPCASAAGPRTLAGSFSTPGVCAARPHTLASSFSNARRRRTLHRPLAHAPTSSWRHPTSPTRARLYQRARACFQRPVPAPPPPSNAPAPRCCPRMLAGARGFLFDARRRRPVDTPAPPLSNAPRRAAAPPPVHGEHVVLLSTAAAAPPPPLQRAAPLPSNAPALRHCPRTLPGAHGFAFDARCCCPLDTPVPLPPSNPLRRRPATRRAAPPRCRPRTLAGFDARRCRHRPCTLP
ncbi:hypothetical protein GGX14DRAFT_562686 [Mycena pura]|uniref:Uncharacterized protein n=1 Tax=Mycena pura TaxID=153505 RepID=A0AAD6VTB0_9AGAR|nr:hypothetical protein GGX14DRAFT_562686 [Mycena pura]